MRPSPPLPRTFRALRVLAVVGLLALLPAGPALADPSGSPSPSPSASPAPSTSPSASPSASASPTGGSDVLHAWFEPATADIYTTTTLVATAGDLPTGGSISVDQACWAT